MSRAKELSTEQVQDRHEVCHELNEQVKAAIGLGRRALYSLAAALHAFDEASAWAPLGYDTLTHWLADPEITMTSATYYRLVGVHRALVVKHRVPLEDPDPDRPGLPTLRELDLSKVAIVLPSIEKGLTPLEEALGDAKSMGARDLREHYAGRGSVPSTPSGTDDGGPSSQAPPSAPDTVEAGWEAWGALRDELVDAGVSGAVAPRVRGDLIGPGLAGLHRILADLELPCAGEIVEDPFAS